MTESGKIQKYRFDFSRPLKRTDTDESSIPSAKALGYCRSVRCADEARILLKAKSRSRTTFKQNCYPLGSIQQVRVQERSLSGSHGCGHLSHRMHWLRCCICWYQIKVGAVTSFTVLAEIESVDFLFLAHSNSDHQINDFE